MNLSDLKILVADDSPLVLSNIRVILREMGAVEGNIFLSKEPKTIFSLCDQIEFNLIICDYNFGPHLNGKQIFDELKHYKKISETAVFIMLTGETQAQVVRSILDLEPDEYMIKPYAVHELKKRIIKACIRKQRLAGLYMVNEDSDPDEALTLCDSLLFDYPEYYSLIQHFRGKFLEMFNRKMEAIDHYQALLSHKDEDWAHIGLANTLIDIGKIEDAKFRLNTLTEKRGRTPQKAYDVIIKSRLFSGDLPDAIKNLKMVNDLIPGNTERHLIIANLCVAMDDYQSALEHYHTYRSLIIGTYRDGFDAFVPYARALLSVAERTPTERLMYLNKFDREIKAYTIDKLTDEQKIAYSLVTAHREILNEDVASALKKLKIVLEDVTLLTFDSKFYAAVLCNLLFLGQEFNLIYASLSEETIDGVATTLIRSQTEMFARLKTLHTQLFDQLNDMITSIESHLVDNKQLAIDMANDAFKAFPYSYRIAEILLMLLKHSWPTTLGHKDVRALIYHAESCVGIFLTPEEKKRANIDLLIKDAKQFFNFRLTRITTPTATPMA